MPADWTSIFTTPALALNWALALAIMGGPLLWRFLNDRPVTWRALLHAAWDFVAMGCWMTFGDIAINARERGLLSEPVTILIVAVLWLTLASSSQLLERWYPEAGP